MGWMKGFDVSCVLWLYEREFGGVMLGKVR